MKQLKAEQQRLKFLVCEKEEMIFNDLYRIADTVEPYWHLLHKLEAGAKIIRGGISIFPLFACKRRKKVSRWKAIAATTVSTLAETGILQSLVNKAASMFASKMPEDDAYYED